MAGDANSPDRLEGSPDVLEVQRGESFFLFPKNKPIKYMHRPGGNVSEVPSPNVVGPQIHVQGIDGVFVANFSGDMSLHRGELISLLNYGEKLVIVTSDGPIELVGGAESNDTAGRLEQDKYTELFSWIIPDSLNAESGVQISLSTPRFTAKYTADSYDYDEGGATGKKYYDFAIDADGKEIRGLIIPLDHEFLRKIRVEIS